MAYLDEYEATRARIAQKMGLSTVSNVTKEKTFPSRAGIMEDAFPLMPPVEDGPKVNLVPPWPHGDQAKRQKFIKENQQNGVSFDPERGAGVSKMDRFWASFRSNYPNDELHFWRMKYPDSNVRRATDGSIYLRVMDKGKPVDRRVDERDLTMGDVADLGSILPEIGAEAVGVFAAGKLPIATASRAFGKLQKLGKFKRMVNFGQQGIAGAVTGQIVGAEADMIAKIADRDLKTALGGESITEIAQTRGTLAAVDTVLGLGIGGAFMGAGKVASKALDPFEASIPFYGVGKATRRQEVKAAVDRLADNYGLEIPLSVAEISQNPTVTTMYGFYSQVPGGQMPAKAAQEIQSEIMNRITNGIMKVKPGRSLASSEDLMNRSSSLMRKYVGDVGHQADLSQEQIFKLAEDKILKEFASKSVGQSVVHDIPVRAEYFNNALWGGRKQFWDISDKKFFPVVNAPEYQQKLFGNRGLAATARNILKNKPTKEFITTTDTGLVDALGRPIMREEITEKTIKAFLPTELNKYLDEIISLENQKMTLPQLTQMRREIYKQIDIGESIPNLTTHELEALGKAITREIDEVTRTLPKGQFRKDLLAANKYYADNIGKFRDKGVKGLFLDSSAPGYKGPISFFTTIKNNPDAYFAVKKILAPNGVESSKAWRILKRSVVDEMLEASRAVNVGSETIDAQTLWNMLHGPLKERAVINDILGSKLSANLSQAIGELHLARSRGILKEHDIDARLNLNKILNSAAQGKDPTVDEIRKMLALNKREAELYQNQIIREFVGTNPADVANINADEFVNKFVRKVNSKDFNDVWDNIIAQDPLLAEEIQRKTIEDIFLRGSRAKNPGELYNNWLFGKVEDPIRTSELRLRTETASGKANITKLLGEETVKDLHAIAIVQETISQIDKMSNVAGGLVRGSIYSNMMSNPIDGIWKAGQFKIMSIVLNSKAARWAANGISPRGADWVKKGTEVVGMTALMSPSGQRALIAEFGLGPELDEALNVARQMFGITTEELTKGSTSDYLDEYEETRQRIARKMGVAP